mmetsp:Transcript_26205/g.81592  ORF Transcript_26205/g.81592 Transcript_26205/m.81592 type:complete len:300 (+) Transcript_26205:279-1178(+)
MSRRARDRSLGLDGFGPRNPTILKSASTSFDEFTRGVPVRQWTFEHWRFAQAAWRAVFSFRRQCASSKTTRSTPANASARAAKKLYVHAKSPCVARRRRDDTTSASLARWRASQSPRCFFASSTHCRATDFGQTTIVDEPPLSSAMSASVVTVLPRPGSSARTAPLNGAETPSRRSSAARRNATARHWCGSNSDKNVVVVRSMDPQADAGAQSTGSSGPGASSRSRAASTNSPPPSSPLSLSTQVHTQSTIVSISASASFDSGPVFSTLSATSSLPSRWSPRRSKRSPAQPPRFKFAAR